MFYFNVANDKEKNFKLIIHKMKVVHSHIYNFGIEQFNSFYYLIPYVPVSQFINFPGRFTSRAIEFYKEKNEFDFTAGDEQYKKQWSNQFYNVNYVLKIKILKVYQFLFICLLLLGILKSLKNFTILKVL